MATEVTARVGPKEVIALGRGRQALEQSVWYSGWLLTFLATGQDTQGQFALQEQVGRKGNVPPAHPSSGRRNFLRARGRDDLFHGRSDDQDHARDNGLRATRCRALVYDRFGAGADTRNEHSRR